MGQLKSFVFYHNVSNSQELILIKSACYIFTVTHILNHFWLICLGHICLKFSQGVLITLYLNV